MEKGIEDLPGWRKSLAERDASIIEICHSCGNKIIFWHCAEVGCPWCAQCGTKPREKEK